MGYRVERKETPPRVFRFRDVHVVLSRDVSQALPNLEFEVTVQLQSSRSSSELPFRSDSSKWRDGIGLFEHAQVSPTR